MGLGSWISDRWGQGGPFGWAANTFERNRGPIGSFYKLGADVLAPFTGPWAPLVAGAGNAIGTAIQKPSDPNDIWRSGLTAGGIGALGYGLGSAFGAPGAAAGAGSATGATGAAPAAGTTGAAAAGPGALGATPAATAAAGTAQVLAKPRPPLMQRVRDAMRGFGSWVHQNPQMIAMGLTDIRDAPLREAYARHMAMLNQQSEYEQERQRARDMALNPIWQALAGQARDYLSGPRWAPPPSPYGG